MKRLSLYLTSSRSSVTIENGACRETSADTLASMLNHMPPDDADILRRFCQVTLAHLDRPEGAAVACNALISKS